MWPEDIRPQLQHQPPDPHQTILPRPFFLQLPLVIYLHIYLYSLHWFIHIDLFILICWRDFIDIRFNRDLIFPFSLISKQTVIRIQHLKIIKRFPPDLERSYFFFILCEI